MDTSQTQRLRVTSLSCQTATASVYTTPGLARFHCHKRIAPPSPRGPLAFLRRNYRPSVVRGYRNYGRYFLDRCPGLHILCGVYVGVIGIPGMPLPAPNIGAAAALDGPTFQYFSASTTHGFRIWCNFNQTTPIHVSSKMFDA
jgi:hypothetical protein